MKKYFLFDHSKRVSDSPIALPQTISEDHEALKWAKENAFTHATIYFSDEETLYCTVGSINLQSQSS